MKATKKLTKKIKRIFTENGFKEKIQENGHADLNSYCYDAAHALINEVLSEGDIWISVSDCLPKDDQRCFVYRWNKKDKGNFQYSIYSNNEYMQGFGDIENEEGFLSDVYYWFPISTDRIFLEMKNFHKECAA